ncbi:ATP-binding protein [uncultured Bilophila sp.]|uniref:hybrid sensor histidine kinase/response regulator n=2 Tax=Bilophila TaxID=35832 RepID=UPI00280C3A82|nr:ATP-binding protein [uncultured Bilophila sp.]
MGFRSVLRGASLNIFVFLVVLALAAGGVCLFRDTLLRNAKVTGMALARNYAAEERSNLAVYETLLAFGTASMDKRLQEGGLEDTVQWMRIYFERLQTVLGDNVVVPYIVLNGKIVDMARQLQEKMPDFTPRESDWFKMAQKNPGVPVFSGVYEDAATGKPVVTIAQKSRTANAVLAFDIFPHYFRFNFLPQKLKSYESFFLCDNNGTLLYTQTGLNVPDNVLQDYVFDLVRKIQNNEFEEYDSYIIDLDGNKRAIYYDRMHNGWYSIVTIPHYSILKESNTLLIFLILSVCIFLAILAILSWRSGRVNTLMKRTNEAVRVLGNSYYALYRVNFENDAYEMIKGSGYVRERVSQTGKYSLLMQVMLEVIEPDAREEYRQNFSCESIRTLVSRKVRDFGGDFRRLFGEEYRWVSVRVLFDESLTPEEVVLCFREIEQEKLWQLQERKLLEDTLEAARRSEKARQAFFANMSHDMRTPLNAIIGMSDLARQALDDKEKVAGYLDKIHYSSFQLKNLIDDILNLSRMEEGRFDLNNQKIDLRQCVQDCLDAYRVQAEVEHKSLQASMELENAWVMADPVRIGQLLNNLLSNAFKFTSADDAISIAVTQIRNTDKYKFVVSDTGIGMSPDFLPHLFEPYARENRFGSKKVAGTGLGMSITKNLVEQMNGEISVESGVGRGSTFTIVLPFVSVDPVCAGEEKEKQDAPDMEALRGKRILLAEDNMVNMELAVEVFSMHGIEVVQAWNGTEAVEQFAASEPFSFHFILMDMQMPELDGCGAARQIRAMNRPDAKSVPIIAVTANAFAEDIVATTAAGMDAHVAKPIDFSLLFSLLEKFIKNG